MTPAQELAQTHDINMTTSSPARSADVKAAVSAAYPARAGLLEDRTHGVRRGATSARRRSKIERRVQNPAELHGVAGAYAQHSETVGVPAILATLRTAGELADALA